MFYEREEPTGRCVSPDGHDYVEAFTYESRIPAAVVCPRCGREWTVTVWEADVSLANGLANGTNGTG